MAGTAVRHSQPAGHRRARAGAGAFFGKNVMAIPRRYFDPETGNVTTPPAVGREQHSGIAPPPVTRSCSYRRSLNIPAELITKETSRRPTGLSLQEPSHCSSRLPLWEQWQGRRPQEMHGRGV